MRVKIEPTPTGEGFIPLPDSLLNRMGWAPGDEVIVHCVHGGTMLVMRTWQKQNRDAAVEE